MEEGQRHCGAVRSTPQYDKVLILVVMEEGQRHQDYTSTDYTNLPVLILVVMEEGQRRVNDVYKKMLVKS